MSSPINMDLSGMLPLGQKWKTLNQFVARIDRQQVDQILADCKDQPSSLFNLLKFLLADRFRRFDLMIELLYAGDTALLNAILSKRWMYEAEKSLIESEFLLEQMFPNVSYICRRKVLHRIGRYARNEQKVDQLWSAVERFGVAFPLIEACSIKLIKSTIASREVQLSGYQVVTLLQKCPDVGLEYFKNHSVKCSKVNPHCSPLQYLYKNRPDDFLDLCINHSDKLRGFKIGRNRSTQLIRAHRAKLLQHPKKTSSLLKRDRIQREFSPEEFQKLFESTLSPGPRNVEEHWQWVRRIPTYKQANMVNKAYEKLYKIDLIEHPEYMNDEYILLLPEKQRLQTIEWKIEKAKKQFVSSWSLKGLFEYGRTGGRAHLFLPLQPISHSAPELKLRLINEELKMRPTLCKYLIATCYLNDDLPELLSVLKVLGIRSRNDHAKVRHEIIDSINKVTRMQLSKQHWDVIMEIILISLVVNDKYYGSAREEIVGKHIAFRLKAKLPLGDLVTVHIKLKLEIRKLSFDNEHIKNPADEHVLMESYLQELERLERTNDLCGYDGSTLSDDNMKDLVIKLIDKVWLLNCESKKGSDIEPISLSSHPWWISHFERIAKEEERQLDEKCKKPATLPGRRQKMMFSTKFALRFSRKKARKFWRLPSKLLKYIQWLRDEQNLSIDAFHGSDYYFSKMLLCFPNHQTIRHFLNTNPSHLLQNWTTSICKMLEADVCVLSMRTIRFWNYSALASATVNYCTDIVHAALGDKTDEAEITRKGNAVLVLSILMEPTDFLALVTKFYPRENSGEAYKMRQAISRSLIHISIPHLAFDALKKFSAGDSLKVVLGSLYSQIQRAQSTKSLDFLRPQLTNVPVSFRTHIIRLYCTIGSVDNKLQALNDVDSSHVSIRYEVFLQIGNLFWSYPNQETWTLLKTAIENTTVDDATILELLHSAPGIHTCPLEYISNYADACLSVLRKLKPSRVDAFITHILKIIKKVPAHWLDKVVLHDLETAESFNPTFCVAYLRYSSSESILEHRLLNISSVLDNVIRRGWDRKSDDQSYPTRLLVLGFINEFANHIRKSSEAWLEAKIGQTLLDKFKTLSPRKFVSEILTLHLALLHVEVIAYDGAERLKRFGRSFAKLVDSLVESYGEDYIFGVMATRTTTESYVKRIFSREIFMNKDVVVELTDEILKTSNSKLNRIFVEKLAISLVN